MDSLKMHSKNITEDNIEKIEALFPNCITEAKDEHGQLIKAIDFDLLRQELSREIVEGSQERYQLNWPGKRQALFTANAPIAKSFRPCPEESIDFDQTRNLFIEGDNLDALKMLQETYLGKMKMIYIDPPYNTGKDFLYKDNFFKSTNDYLFESYQKDSEGNHLVTNLESHGRFHSDWLSMMYSRLKLARNLLKDNGVIFISIDDNEHDNLKKICDEIFGMENALFQYTIKVRYEGKTLVEDMLYQKVVETVLVYSKNKESVELVRQEEEYNYDKFIWDIEEIGEPEEILLGDKRVQLFSKDKYRIVKKNADKQLLKEIWATGSILDGNSSGRFFRDYLTGRYETDGYGMLYKVYGIGDDERPYRYFTGPKKLGATKGKYYQGVPKDKLDNVDQIRKTKPISTFYDMSADFGNCRHEGGIDFRNGKKPLALIKKLCEIVKWEQNDIVFDFFAGSGTTGQAIMELNKEDCLNRKFILVQFPEQCDPKSETYKLGFKTIAEITKERIRHSGKKIKEESTNKNGVDNLDTGFRVLKVDSSNMAEVYYNSNTINQDLLSRHTDNVKPDRTPEDLLFQVLLDWGVDLTLPLTKKIIHDHEVFFVDQDALVACFDNNGKITEEFVKELSQYSPLRVVFRDAGFASDSVKINVTQIFKQLSPHTEVKTI